MKHFLITVFILITCFVTLMGCASSHYKMAPMAVEESNMPEPDAYAMQMNDNLRAEPVFARKKSLQKNHNSPSPSNNRMLHYDGYIKLKATKPSDVIDKSVSTTKKAGGYVEKRTNTLVTLRIPVKKFHIIYKECLNLGVVIKKSISATDITDKYADITLRLKIAKKALNRYISLLNKTNDEKEKLKILKEISRLSEQIEYLSNSSKMISKSAAFSRLTIEVIPANTISKRNRKLEIKGFNWINELSPFTRRASEKEKKYEFKVPEKMVLLDEKPWVTESADGVVFWAYKRENNPQGDTDFWTNAVKIRLKDDFKKLSINQAGKFKFIKLISLTEKPYVYYVGIQASGSSLIIFEVYYPDKNLEKKYSQSILESIKTKRD